MVRSLKKMIEGMERLLGREPFVSKPEILCHPNIPKPLHGLAPRNIMGEAWWDQTRRETYARTGYRCVACTARRQRLEAHEFWHINYRTGRCKVTSIEPLCHSCHNFIHSGRLEMICGTEKTAEEVVDILEHGFRVLSKHKLKCFPLTYVFATQLGANTLDVEPYRVNVNKNLKWSDWRLEFNGKVYHPKYKNEEEWAAYYQPE